MLPCQFARFLAYDAEEDYSFPMALQAAVESAGDGNMKLIKNIKTLLKLKLPGNLAIIKSARIKNAVMIHIAGGLAATFRAMKKFQEQHVGIPNNGFDEAKVCARLKYHTYRCNREFDSEVCGSEVFNAVEEEVKRYGLIVKLPYYNAMRDAILDRVGKSSPAYTEPADGIDMPN